MRTGFPLVLLVACSSSAPRSPEPPLGLGLRFLAVGGWHLKVGDDALITAPMFTNPSIWDMSMGEIAPEPGPVDRFLGDVSDATAILVGHGHYDHLLDVPYVRTLTADATVYGNDSTQRLLAGFAPDPAATCPPDTEPPPPWAVTPRDRVVALNDPADDVVDYRNHDGAALCTDADLASPGRWVDLPASNVRIRAIASRHAPQYGDLHFGEGCVTEEPCGPVRRADAWREGTTLAFLVDFLGPNGEIAVRVFYHDAPSRFPVGYPHAEDLRDHPVDVALLNAGNYEQVEGFPAVFLDEVKPRYALLGHWENFFRTLDEPDLLPIPGLDLELLRANVDGAWPGGEGTRWWIPEPGDTFDL